MQILKDKDHKSKVKLALLLVQESYLPEYIKEFNPVDKFINEVDIKFILETFVKAHYHGEATNLQNLFFSNNVLRKFQICDVLYGKGLKCVKFVIFFTFIKTDLSILTTS